MLYHHHGIDTGFSGAYHEYFGPQVCVSQHAAPPPDLPHQQPTISTASSQAVSVAGAQHPSVIHLLAAVVTVAVLIVAVLSYCGAVCNTCNMSLYFTTNSPALANWHVCLKSVCQPRSHASVIKSHANQDHSLLLYVCMCVYVCLLLARLTLRRPCTS